MNEAPEVPSPTVVAPTATPSWGLWGVCLVVIAAVLVAWSGDRAKPLVVFPLLLGAALAGAASLFAMYCDLPRRRWAVVAVILGAGVLVLASYYVAAKRQRLDEAPVNPLAERLIQQFEKQAPASAAPAASAIQTYLQHRYANGERVRIILCLLGESAAAGMGAAVVIRLLWRTRTSDTAS